MLREIQEGINYICTLINVTNKDEEKQNQFCKILQERLEKRFKNIWFKNDPERGSGKRSIVWHSHGGGEGMDKDLKESISICFKITTKKDFENFFIDFNGNSISFTLWIDPDCVAIRIGLGPGNFIQNQNLPCPTTIKIIFGSISSIRPTPSMTISSNTKSNVPPPILTLLPSTPALDLENFDSNTKQQSLSNHFRSPSWASSIRSSSNGSLSSSSSSGGSRSTSNSSSEGYEGSEACPSLIAASSTRGDSDSEMFDDDEDDDDEEDGEDSNSESSIQDLMDRGGFKNFHIIDDDEEEEEQCGDETVQDVKSNLKINDSSSKKVANVTSYDGGNVGVLGGGVRLGAAKQQSTTTQQNKQSFTNPSLQNKISSNNLRAKQIQAPVWHPSQNHWTSIERSPALSNQHHQQKQQQQWSIYSPSIGGGMKYSPAMGAAGCPSPQYVIIDGVAVPIATPPLKRSTRGRRSRGRGAGRAARRAAAAAAAKAQQEWSPLEENSSSALGITLNPSTTTSSQSPTSSSNYNSVLTDFEADSQLMAMVRQRADQVAKDLVRRHLEKQSKQQHHASFTPRNNFTPTMPSIHQQQQQQQQFHHGHPMTIGHHLPPHMMSHMHNVNNNYSHQHFSPISQNAQWIH